MGVGPAGLERKARQKLDLQDDAEDAIATVPFSLDDIGIPDVSEESGEIVEFNMGSFGLDTSISVTLSTLDDDDDLLSKFASDSYDQEEVLASLLDVFAPKTKILPYDK